jgi:hypothetical protein
MIKAFDDRSKCSIRDFSEGKRGRIEGYKA